MSLSIHLFVTFAADKEPVARLAHRHLATAKEDPAIARWFLEDLASGGLTGQRGVAWGGCFNAPPVEEFVKSLEPFWRDLLAGYPEDHELEGCPLEWERVLVFYEVEDTEHASCWQIGWDDEDSQSRSITYQHHEELPFSWRA